MSFDTFKVLEDNFRSYDVRGVFPDEIDASTAYAIAQAFLKYNPAKRVVIGHDQRQSVPELKEGLIQGFLHAGVDVWDIGQVTTDMTYFASWKYLSDQGIQGAIMITASHMPAEFNGFKFITKDLKPIGKGSGMEELYSLASEINEIGPLNSAARRTVIKKNILADYLEFLMKFVDKEKIKPLKVVMDAGNGVAGPIAREVFRPFGLDITEMYFEPDSTFPNHEANPILPENRKDIIEKVKEVGADLGIAWDADADRAYFIDEKGNFVHGDFATALLSILFLKKTPGANIVYDLRASNVVPDTIKKYGGVPHMQKVGHSHIKKMMRETDSVFGGEVSGHYYFSDNHFMDNGFIPALMILQLLSESGKPLSEFIRDLGEYYVSGEINSEVKDRKKVIEVLKDKYADANQTFLDGISIEYSDWRCNIRPSANDPVIRLNLEANSQKLMEEKRDEVLEIIRNN